MPPNKDYIPRECINDVVKFCYKFDIPSVGSAVTMYEQLYHSEFGKYNNKHVALTEIFSQFADIYKPYWDEKLRNELNKYKR